MTKTVPLSVRISHEDADFIAQLQMDGAVTPSDKVRTIIRTAREDYQRGEAYAQCLHQAQAHLQQVVRQVKAMELEEGAHSELLNLFMDWVSEAYAFVEAANHALQENKMTLQQFEAGITQRIFRLFEVVLRYGVTQKAPCYNPNIISEALHPLAELTTLITNRINGENT